MKRTDHQIVQQVLDGEVSKEVFDRFQERLRGEPELVKLYSEYANLQNGLSEEFEDLPIQDTPEIVHEWRSFNRFAWLAAAAAVVLIGWLAYRGLRPGISNIPVMANVRFSADAVWQLDKEFKQLDGGVGLVKGSTLRLRQGQADILTGGTMSALIDGPATLTVVSETVFGLSAGRGRFRMENPDAKLEVTTPSISAVDLGTEFGVEVRAGQPDEMHVFDGKVRMRINGNSDGEVLTTGEAGRVSGDREIARISTDEARFLRHLMVFKPLVTGRFVRADWSLEYGTPSISESRIDGENYSIFLKLPKAAPSTGNPVLIATLKVDRPASGEFHTDGWAGLSFFSEGKELLFFGDSFGPERTWSLDVKQRMPVVIPANPVLGARTVTLRYDSRSGDVTLHEGGMPLTIAFCSGKLPAGLSFDAIRLGASSSAALAVGGLTIQTGGEEP